MSAWENMQPGIVKADAYFVYKPFPKLTRPVHISFSFTGSRSFAIKTTLPVSLSTLNVSRPPKLSALLMGAKIWIF